MDILQGHFDEDVLSDQNKVLNISKEVGEFLLYKQPLISGLLINNAILLSKKLKGSFNPELIRLFLLKYKTLFQTGDIDEMYKSINDAFILTLLNHKYYSEETLVIFNSYRKFSLLIEEMGEHEIYSHKMEEILKRLVDVNKNNDVKLLYYSFDIINGLTSFSENSYNLPTLKKYYRKYEDLRQTKLYKNFKSDQANNKELLVHILYCKIKIKYFFKKDTKENILKEMNNLVNFIRQNHGEYSHLLINSYIFLIKFHLKNKDKEQFDKLFLENWCDLIDNLYNEDPLLTANCNLLLLRSILNRDKDFEVMLSNLVSFIGDNYAKVFNYASTPSKTHHSFLYAEACYLGAYISRDEANMHPLELIDSAAFIYSNVLGANSEKYKKAMNLHQIISKRYEHNKEYNK